MRPDSVLQQLRLVSSYLLLPRAKITGLPLMQSGRTDLSFQVRGFLIVLEAKAAEFERQNSALPAAVREGETVGTLTCWLKAVCTRQGKAALAAATAMLTQQ